MNFIRVTRRNHYSCVNGLRHVTGNSAPEFVALGNGRQVLTEEQLEARRNLAEQRRDRAIWRAQQAAAEKARLEQESRDAVNEAIRAEVAVQMAAFREEFALRPNVERADKACMAFVEDEVQIVMPNPLPALAIDLIDGELIG